jgi:hypothetical protein
MNGWHSTVVRLVDAFHNQGGFKSLNRFGKTLATADLGDDITDGVKNLGGITIEGPRTAMVVSLPKRPEGLDSERG